MFLKKRNIISKMKRSKVTDYAALIIHTDGVFVLLINVKMPSIGCILTFMSMIYSMFTLVEYEKKTSSGPCHFSCSLLLMRFGHHCKEQFILKNHD